jgi:hypothetical protein
VWEQGPRLAVLGLAATILIWGNIAAGVGNQSSLGVRNHPALNVLNIEQGLI